MRLSSRARSISTSPTLALDAKTKKLQREGINIINFGVGEPDFDTPQHIKDAAIESIQAGFTKYTPSSGIPELREAICEKLKKDNGLEYKPSEVLVSVGAKHSIYNAVMVLCDEGDEVLLPAPYWVSYPEMVKLAGGTPVILPTSIESGFKVTAQALEKAITPRTTLLILNSPSNPTGAIYTREELEKIAEVCLKHNIAVISDEIYEKLIYEGEHVSFAALSPEVKAITITVNGVSKAYAMTGWRIGYAAGPEDVIKAMGDLQSHATSNPTSISQKAALAGLKGPQEPLEKMRMEFKKRRDYMVERLNKMPGIRCLTPPGAFYVYPDVSGLIGKKLAGKVVSDDTTLADILLDEARIAVVPGKAFGTQGNLRFSYATSMAKIEEGLNRLENVLKTLE
ncbi:MAG: pyridoxal phosphate-dependent aminotransferase [Candidatus Fermentithermobacillus carboniphilus]|uniref:Aminotransferase n=1 Tax=Candidatus Fermentithermobacillus carboniphilus TaxID=3085328 RepID=A0AAT9LDA1_9FIRM|nr:MAG: pyridoxal phosphate-dependent aminotransferase [Candidatus Fermentithermobacillus carboniphilus]